MTSFKLFGAALILSTAFATPVFAQVAEPGDYAFSQEPGLSAVYRQWSKRGVDGSQLKPECLVIARLIFVISPT